MKASLSFVVSFLVTLFVLPHLAHLAQKIGLIDDPGSRKIHLSPKPLVGGIGMVIGIAISSMLLIPLANLRGLYTGIILLVIVGFFDDFREIEHSWKFLTQIVAALFMVYFSNTVLHSFGDLVSYGPITFHRASVFLTVFSTLGVINAINMIDGLDGLAGGVSLVAFMSFAILAFMDLQKELFLLSIAFSGAVLAFLRYNWYPSRLFMGDAGSATFGFALTFMAIAITQRKGSSIPPVAPLLILAVPIVDTLTVMIKRMLIGKSSFKSDKSHLHHILLRFGFHTSTVALIIIIMTSLFSVFGISGVMLAMPEHYMFAVFMVYFALYFTASFYIKRIYKLNLKLRLKRGLKEQ